MADEPKRPGILAGARLSSDHGKQYLALFSMSVFTKFTGFSVLAAAYYFLPGNELGLYFLGMSLASILVLATGLNLTPVLIRRVSVESEQLSSWMSAFLVLRSLLSLTYFVSFIGVAWLMGFGDRLDSLALIALFIILEDIDSTFANLFIARNRLRYHILATVISYGLLVAAFFGFLNLFGCSLQVLILAQVTKTVALVTMSLCFIHLRIAVLSWKIPWKAVGTLVLESIPFFLIAMSALSYRHIMNLWLSWYGWLDLAGDFGLAFFVVNGFLFFTYMNNSIVYPRICKDRSGMPGVLKFGSAFNLAGGVSIAALVWALMPVLAEISALQRYVPVMELLGSLIWVVPGMFLSAFLSVVLYGLGQEKTVLVTGFAFLLVFTVLSGAGLNLFGKAALSGSLFAVYSLQAGVLALFCFRRVNPVLETQCTSPGETPSSPR